MRNVTGGHTVRDNVSSPIPVSLFDFLTPGRESPNVRSRFLVAATILFYLLLLHYPVSNEVDVPVDFRRVQDGPPKTGLKWLLLRSRGALPSLDWLSQTGV